MIYINSTTNFLKKRLKQQSKERSLDPVGINEINLATLCYLNITKIIYYYFTNRSALNAVLTV